MLKLKKEKILSRKPSGFSILMAQLRGLILSAHQRVLHSVDVIQVRTCWAIGHHVVEYEQKGAHRADYGTKLLERLAKKLSREFGKGFDARNLRNMRAFYSEFPKWNAVRTELSWTHYRLLLRVGDVQARRWYMTEAVTQNWRDRKSTRLNSSHVKRSRMPSSA